MTWYGAARPGTRTERGSQRETSGGAVHPLDELGLVLAEAAVHSIGAVGGHAGGVYLRSETPGLLRLAVAVGLPAELLRPWWRMHINRPFPVAECYRRSQAIHLADGEEAMQRFPQLMAGLPFSLSSLYAPVTSGDERFGVLATLRPATSGGPVAEVDRRRFSHEGSRLAAALGELHHDGTPVRWDKEPLAVQVPEADARPVRVGTFDWDLGSGALSADVELCAILGVEAAAFPGTIETLTAHVAPEDAYQLHAVAREAGRTGRAVVRRIRMRRDGEPPCLVELTGRPVRSSPGTAARRVTGSVMDLGSGAVFGEAGDRLPQGLFSLDLSCRITDVNRSAAELIGTPRDLLVGRVLWEAVPWLDRAGYGDQYRAALLARAPVRFRADRGQDGGVTVSLFPGRKGVTGTVASAERTDHTTGAIGFPGAASGTFASAADRSSALYRPVALAIALTEAVTARQVSEVVTEELLPAFGGRQLAIYVLRERHLHLAWETGFPAGFLAPFEGVGLDARIPGVETLTSGRPIFFESMDMLASAYPGLAIDASVGARAFLPLIASGRPVGSCILGFDHPRGFAPEERTALTALAGLIAQALERAQRYDSEFALARGLQDALLPHRLPVVAAVETVGRYLPGTQGLDVGGDWYDVIETDRGLALVIGDVQGHGVPAAAIMGQLRSAVRAFALDDREPEEVMSGTNRLLIDLDPAQLATCCYVLLDPDGGTAQAVRAGHPQPLLRRPDGATEVLDLPGGLMLGVASQERYPVSELTLEPGAVLALFTDGLIEEAGADIDAGVERLRTTLGGVGGITIAETADRLIREARQATDRPDDIALLLTARWPGREADRILAGPGRW
ncbi:SpoIIE family protein phosphatase [Streptomyces pacificus]|uniref:SpoIIE family protein phosphatase n=1 Tax=Streptomyces pacificus TaxID=2705029 RepID=UPI00280A6351|nr:SpoIIE family protein phosphatase [Streptomyces pacificus]